jgi:carboxymethylenebutenolidase
LFAANLFYREETNLMCISDGCNAEINKDEGIERRSFLTGATAALVAIALGPEATGQQQSKALDDPNITHGKVSFKSGSRIIDGYLARPKRRGRFASVIIVPGNRIEEPYIPETAAMLAQNGFIGLAVNIYHLMPVSANPSASPTSASPQEQLNTVANKMPDEFTMQDIQAGLDYLKSQSFVRRKRMGIMGFCSGGRYALMFTAQSNEIAAVVSFYGTLILPPIFNRKRTPFDVIKQIRVPIQGHYGTKDNNAPLADAKRFEAALRAQKTPAQIFTYETGHGFFAYNRDEVYQPDAAKLAKERTLAFFKRHLR